LTSKGGRRGEGGKREEGGKKGKNKRKGVLNPRNPEGARRSMPRAIGEGKRNKTESWGKVRIFDEYAAIRKGRSSEMPKEKAKRLKTWRITFQRRREEINIFCLQNGNGF